jgi:hypothetical protein
MGSFLKRKPIRMVVCLAIAICVYLGLIYVVKRTLGINDEIVRCHIVVTPITRKFELDFSISDKNLMRKSIFDPFASAKVDQ